MSDENHEKSLYTLRTGRITFSNESKTRPPMERNPYISGPLYNAFDKLKRKYKETRRKTNLGARTVNRGAVAAAAAKRGANLKSRSANRRATLNAKNKEKEKLLKKIEEEIQIKQARINYKKERKREREEAAASASASAEANNNQQSDGEEQQEIQNEMDAIQELVEMMATLRIRNNNNSNNSNYNARDPWLRANPYEEE